MIRRDQIEISLPQAKESQRGTRRNLSLHFLVHTEQTTKKSLVVNFKGQLSTCLNYSLFSGLSLVRQKMKHVERRV